MTKRSVKVTALLRFCQEEEEKISEFFLQRRIIGIEIV
jgi:hypothetical protein